MQDEVVWKINWDAFRIALKVRCDKNTSEFCCGEAFFAPILRTCSALATAFSNQFQQSLFNRTSLSNPSAGNIRPVSKGLGTEVFLLSPFSLSLSFNSWGLMGDTLFQKDSVLRASLALPGFGSSALLISFLGNQESSQSQNVSLGWLKQRNILYN